MQTSTRLAFQRALRQTPLTSTRCPPRTFSWRWPATVNSAPVRGYADEAPKKPEEKETVEDKARLMWEDRYKNKSAVGVFSPISAALFVAAGAGLYWYFTSEKQRMIQAREEERQSRSVGRANIGGPFEMTTHEGKVFNERDLLGKWSLIYFGFTNCPDICPEELDKMTDAINILDKKYGPIMQPIFISVDPARDTIPQMARYVGDFHPRMIGLTGSYETAKKVCKAYRVYFSTPPNTKATDDYLVDHSIYFYFMDPDGKFVDAFGKSTSVEQVVERVEKELGEWKAERGSLA
ncbi:SCO1 protein [Peniophora sp. CONT]|nr:SCO1 protein [Peniophora sp. CONT]